MASKKKLYKWYRVQESGGPFDQKMTWDIKIDIQYGMSFEELRREMTQIEEDHGGDFDEFRIEPREEYDWGDEHPRKVYYVEGLREETDEEYEARIKEFERAEAAMLERRREQFEALQKEFGNKA